MFADDINCALPIVSAEDQLLPQEVNWEAQITWKPHSKIPAVTMCLQRCAIQQVGCINHGRFIITAG